MKNNHSYIGQEGATIITELNPEKPIKDLYSLLQGIGNDVNNNPIINFNKLSDTHFIRWFIVEGVFDGSGEKVPEMLVMASCYDGSSEEHIAQLLDNAEGGMDKIYWYCKDYPGNNNGNRSEKIKYFKSHLQKNQLFWTGLRGGTVEQILGEQKLRKVIQKHLNELADQGQLKNATPETIKENITKFVASQPDLSWALKKRASPNFAWFFRYYGKLVFRLSALLLLLPVLLVMVPLWVFVFARIFEKKDDRDRKPIERPKIIDELLEKEDRIFMNQFTIYGTIKKPYWFRLTSLKAGLWLFSTNGGYRATKGKLSGIETIHFARWCIFNKGRNVMFLSDYDGAWQIYLSEFIDRSAAAMNLTFGTTVGYPKVKNLFWEGAFDEQAFKTAVRNNQYPTQVYFSRYPYLTIKNIMNNAMIRKVLDGSSKESIHDWLKRI